MFRGRSGHLRAAHAGRKAGGRRTPTPAGRQARGGETMKGLLAGMLAVAALAAPARAEPAEPPKPASHTTRDVEGWTVRVDDRLLGGPDRELGDRAVRLLSNQLCNVRLV